MNTIRATIVIDETDDTNRVLERIRKKGWEAGLSGETVRRIMEEIEERVTNLRKMGTTVTAAGGQMRTESTVAGDGYAIVIRTEFVAKRSWKDRARKWWRK